MKNLNKFYDPIGTVLTNHAIEKSTGKKVAVVYYNSFEKEEEFRWLKQISHPNLTKVLDAGLFNKKKACIEEFVPGFSLKDFNDNKIDERTLIEIMTQITDVCAYMAYHQRSFSDLACNDITVTSGGQIKLSPLKFIFATNKNPVSILGSFCKHFLGKKAPKTLTQEEYQEKIKVLEKEGKKSLFVGKFRWLGTSFSRGLRYVVEDMLENHYSSLEQISYEWQRLYKGQTSIAEFIRKKQQASLNKRWELVSVVVFFHHMPSLFYGYLHKFAFPLLRQWCYRWQLQLNIVEIPIDLATLDKRIKEFSQLPTVFIAILDKDIALPETITKYILAEKSDFEKLACVVGENVKSSISEIFQSHIEKFWQQNSKEKILQEIFVQAHSEKFVARNYHLEGLRDELEDKLKKENNLAITGKSSIGKSTLLARFYRDFKYGYFHSCKGWQCIAIFVQASPSFRNFSFFLHWLISCLQNKTPHENNVIQESPAKIEQLLQQLSSLINNAQKKLIILDGLDHFETSSFPDGKVLHPWDWFYGKSSKSKEVKIILSGDYSQTEIKKLWDVDVLPITPLFTSEQKKMRDILPLFLPLLKRKAKLKLEGNIEDPLSWRIVFEGIGIESAEEITQKTQMKDLKQLFFLILDKLEQEYHTEFLQTFFPLLLCSRGGLKIAELEKIFIEEKENVQKLIAQLENYLYFLHGWVNLSGEFAAVSSERYLFENEKIHWHQYLADFFAREPLYLAGKANLRKLTQQIWHQVHGKMHLKLLETLSDINFLQAKTEANLLLELIEDFAAAITCIPGNLEIEIAPKIIINSKVLSVIQKILQMELAFLTNYPKCLFQTLFNYGYWYDNPQNIDYFEKNDLFHRESTNAKIYKLVEYWEAQQNRTWIKSLRPLPITIDHPLTKTFYGHKADITHICFSHDKKKMASASKKSIKIWDLHTTKELISIAEGADILCFSPDGTKIAAAYNKEICIYDVYQGKILKHHPIEGNIFSICFSPDAKKILLGTSQGAYLLENETKTIHNLIQNNTLSVAFSPDGSKMVLGYTDSIGKVCICIWDSYKTAQIREFPKQSGSINKVAFNKNGKEIIVLYQKTIQFFSLKGKQLSFVEGNTFARDFSFDGEKVAWKRSGNLEVRNRANELLICLPGNNNKAFFGPQDLLVTCEGYLLRLWDLKEKREFLSPLCEHESPIETLCFSLKENQAISASRNMICTWDCGHAKKQNHFCCDQVAISPKIYLSPNESLAVLTGFNNNDIKILDIAKGSIVATLSEQTSVSSISFDSTGYKMAAANHSHTFIWDLKNNKVLNRIHKGGTISLSPNAKMLAAHTIYDTQIWNLATGLPLHQWTYGSYFTCFSSDSEKIAIVGIKNEIRVLEVKTGKLLRSLESIADIAEKNIEKICFNSDGDKILIQLPDKIQVLDIDKAQLVKNIEGRGNIDFISQRENSYQALSRSKGVCIEKKEISLPFAFFPGKIDDIAIFENNLIIGHAGNYVYFLKLYD